jgi:hypothetical protein
MASYFRCPYCERDDFASSKGLQQHQQGSKACKTQIESLLKTPMEMPAIAHDYLQMMANRRSHDVNAAPQLTSILKANRRFFSNNTHTKAIQDQQQLQ